MRQKLAKGGLITYQHYDSVGAALTMEFMESLASATAGVVSRAICKVTYLYGLRDYCRRDSMCLYLSLALIAC